jgi:hypothetical protein
MQTSLYVMKRHSKGGYTGFGEILVRHSGEWERRAERCDTDEPL